MTSSWHTCEVREVGCQGNANDGEFLDYNGARTTNDGRTACSRCRDIVDRNGVDATTNYLFPGAAAWFADRGEIAPPQS